MTKQQTQRLREALFLAAVGFTASLFAQDFEDQDFRSGLVGHYLGSDDGGAARVTPQLAFTWSDQAPDRRLPNGPFQVRWQGNLMSQAAGDYRIAAFVRGGKVEVELGGKSVLTVASAEGEWLASAPLTLDFDFHPLDVHFEKQQSPAQFALYWSGPQFQFEPIPVDSLFHSPGDSPDPAFDRGHQLVRALRCAACHEIPREPQPLNAPSLVHVAGSLRRSWLVDRLRSQHDAAGTVRVQRMPHYGLSRADAEAIADYLFSASTESEWSPPPAGQKGDRRPRGKARKVDPLKAGERLFLTIGCRACHEPEAELPTSLFGGGSLAFVGQKRPPEFFEQWLAAPETINPDHRMPVFALTPTERSQLAAYLGTLGGAVQETAAAGQSHAGRGRQLIAKLRCHACHQLPGFERQEIPLVDLPVHTSRPGCFTTPDRDVGRPGYHLADADRQALARFLEEVVPGDTPSQPTAAQTLVERNCLACHARGGSRGLTTSLADWAKEQEELAPLIPAMTPPSLEQIGDKLHETALHAAIERKGAVYRDYLLVRMPKFRLGRDEQDQLVEHFVRTDRLPPEAVVVPPAETGLDTLALAAAGRRLVTADGFGCTSCHQIGTVQPSKAPLNTRGPNLTGSGNRIRRSWYDRFVRNPSRINRAMEMPSVRLAVRGVLDERLDRQLAAVWEIVNQPGFEPPEPDPLRVVRHTDHSPKRATVTTDVVRTRDRVYVKPLLIGLHNRHSLLLDLETASLTRWSIGDTARQRTEGKTWYWEAAGTELLHQPPTASDVWLTRDDQSYRPEPAGQFATQIDTLEHSEEGVSLGHRLHFSARLAGEPTVLQLDQQFTPIHDGHSTGFQRSLTVTGVPSRASVRFRVIASTAGANVTDDGRSLEWQRLGVRVSLADETTSARWSSPGTLELVNVDGVARAELVYQTTRTVDRFVGPVTKPHPPAQETLRVVPGFEATRLPVSADMMPTALHWRPNGELVVGSLAGRVWTVRDADGDGLEDDLLPFSDDLAAPYGVYATDDYVDVITKYALLRLFDDDGDRRVDRTVRVASGWGHTTDYHDWAAGLPRDTDGGYFVALSCQQDERSEAAAYLRGKIIKLIPREETQDDPSLFEIQQLTGGHRFPMGLALRNDGELFVTDNQGNYNPFNELNHVVAGRRFGFINLLERKPGFDPPLTPPAINLPHPWTRSVNGICFLQAPQVPGQSSSFGPFEGHLIGCEYDTRRLVRMSLQLVNGEYQGAAYPFSYDLPTEGPPFLGPLVCAISPAGDIYVGGIQDSGWGGGNNIGELVRLRPSWEELPCGIKEVRALSDGIQIEFTRPVDRQAATDPQSYSISTYTRTSTPAYGGDDQQRRNQPIRNVQLMSDLRTVSLRLDPLLAGHVYGIHLKNVAPQGEEFFPAQAHYTMRSIPK